MSTMWKTGIQVGLVLLAGGALMLSGGVASATPGDAPPGARAECAVVQLPGMDMQLSEPGACVSVLLPGTVGGASRPTPVGDQSPPAPGANPSVGDASPPAPNPAPVGDASPPAPNPAPVGDASPPAQAQSLPIPCLDVQLPGVRISIGDASPPTQCFVAPTS